MGTFFHISSPDSPTADVQVLRYRVLGVFRLFSTQRLIKFLCLTICYHPLPVLSPDTVPYHVAALVRRMLTRDTKKVCCDSFDYKGS